MSYNEAMEIIRTVFIIVWLILSCLLTGFIYWRKLRRERVDSEDGLIDHAIVAFLIAVGVGRVVFVLFHFKTFGFDLPKWLSLLQQPGLIGVVALVTAVVAFGRLLGDEWKDKMEQVDYLSIALAFFLFLATLGDLITQGIGLIETMFLPKTTLLPSFDYKTLVISSLYMIFYLVLFLFLSSIEKTYRTFLWYRAKRRSAQTGFVVASFLIGYGGIGFILGWFQPMTLQIVGTGIDPLVKLLVMVSGFVILYLRSGRSFLGYTA